MKITLRQLKNIIRESTRAGELMLIWNELQVGDLVDVDGEYNYYPKIRITQKVDDVSRISGLTPGPGFVGNDEYGDDIVFSVEDVSAESYQKYVFAENKNYLKEAPLGKGWQFDGIRCNSHNISPEEVAEAMAVLSEFGYSLFIPATADSNNMAINDALEAYPGEYTYEDFRCAIGIAQGRGG